MDWVTGEDIRPSLVSGLGDEEEDRRFLIMGYGVYISLRYVRVERARIMKS
jgi:hypothetical protein